MSIIMTSLFCEGMREVSKSVKISGWGGSSPC